MNIVHINTKVLRLEYRSLDPFHCKSIYLYTWLISTLKGDSQDNTFRVQRDFTLPSPFVPCLFIGENTKEGLLRFLNQSLFYCCLL